MLINFFFLLKQVSIPVSIKELLMLLEGLQERVAFCSIDDFYLLARLSLVKDERFFDRYDRAFAAYFKEVENLQDILDAFIPEDWLRAEFMKSLSEEEKAKIKSLGGLEKLLEAFKERMEEQKERHAGGSKWIGTGGTSPFGHSGYHPEGIRVGGESKNRSAVKVWEKREYKDLDDSVELGTRNLKIALRKLRKFARTGATEELDLDDTISSTAKNAGLLDIKMIPERHNAVKVLLFFDIGGSMDPFIKICEELFSACKTEFKHLEYFYFHNFIYESVWKSNVRRWSEKTSLNEVLRTYGKDYKVIFIGDASMASYEISHSGGSVEHMNEEPGYIWMQRIKAVFNKVIWLNPVADQYWDYTHSISMVKQLIDDEMYPLTLNGLESGIKSLA
ncbi:MAG: VWA domain-containing protein [Gammaproteobacteria bacterium]|nr:VWA domain-containing protein [Gammaproteobacteria bacterium]